MKLPHVKEMVARVRGRLESNEVTSFLLRVAESSGRIQNGDMAASIAYYAILSLFPLLLGIIAILGYFLPTGTVQQQLFDIIRSDLPGSLDLVKQNIDQVISLRGTLGILSLAGLLWTGSSIFGAIGRAVNRAWGITKFRPYYIRKSRDIFIAVASSLLFYLSLAMSFISSYLQLLPPVFQGWPVAALTRLLSFLLLAVMLALIYKFMPNYKTSWGNIWPGIILATILLEAMRSLFVFYLQEFANFQLVYGSVASVIVLLVWLYVASFIIILGAQFSAEYSATRSRRSAD
jgi:membrane protein